LKLSGVASTVDGLIEQLRWAGARAANSGLVQGSGGNLSARLPGSDVCVVTASGTWLDELERSDFSQVRLNGELVDGNATPSSEVKLHLESYAARPDATAIIHMHPQLSVLLDALHKRIRLVTIDHVYYVRHIEYTPWYPSGSHQLAKAGAEALAHGNVVILGHHGCSVVADSVELAYKRAANLEEAAVATYRALMLGDTDTECPAAYRELLAELAAQGQAAAGA
jgi:ribulose-5-phosphate 4-epimerase/fuculose-1-phosphate aldolase